MKASRLQCTFGSRKVKTLSMGSFYCHFPEIKQAVRGLPAKYCNWTTAKLPLKFDFSCYLYSPFLVCPSAREFTQVKSKNPKSHKIYTEPPTLRNSCVKFCGANEHFRKCGTNVVQKVYAKEHSRLLAMCRRIWRHRLLTHHHRSYSRS